ncbi:MAG: FAD-linked oxidase C-terminal domain-containing protein, partial [Acidimicrobiales bacterium]
DVDGTCALIVLDEGDGDLVAATMGVVAEQCRGAHTLDVGLVEDWMGHRNDVSALASLYQHGIVVDTIEVCAPWSKLAGLYGGVVEGLGTVEGLLACSAHQSHAYVDGACLYFTFAGRTSDPDDDDWAESFYRLCWSRVMAATMAAGGSISHHHGIGLVRSGYMSDALGSGFAVLGSIKQALDPKGILNPGKLGLDSSFGPQVWPAP